MTSRKQPTGEKRADFNCVPKLKFLDDKPRKVYFDYLCFLALYSYCNFSEIIYLESTKAKFLFENYQVWINAQPYVPLVSE